MSNLKQSSYFILILIAAFSFASSCNNEDSTSDLEKRVIQSNSFIQEENERLDMLFQREMAINPQKATIPYETALKIRNKCKEFIDKTNKLAKDEKSLNEIKNKQKIIEEYKKVIDVIHYAVEFKREYADTLVMNKRNLAPDTHFNKQTILCLQNDIILNQYKSVHFLLEMTYTTFCGIHHPDLDISISKDPTNKNDNFIKFKSKFFSQSVNGYIFLDELKYQNKLISIEGNRDNEEFIVYDSVFAILKLPNSKVGKYEVKGHISTLDKNLKPLKFEKIFTIQ